MDEIVETPHSEPASWAAPDAAIYLTRSLEFFEEVADGAGDVDAAGDATLTILDALDDAGGLRAFGAVGTSGGVHDLFTVAGFGNLCHGAWSP